MLNKAQRFLVTEISLCTQSWIEDASSKTRLYFNTAPMERKAMNRLIRLMALASFNNPTGPKAYSTITCGKFRRVPKNRISCNHHAKPSETVWRQSGGLKKGRWFLCKTIARRQAGLNNPTRIILQSAISLGCDAWVGQYYGTVASRPHGKQPLR